MKEPFMFEPWPFEDEYEFWNETGELNPDFFEQEWQGETNRDSPAFVKWIQDSLNKVMGLRLAVDGVMGPMTRSAIRSFQQKNGLAVDGVAGPQTEAALQAALAALQTVPPYTTPPSLPPPSEQNTQQTIYGWSQYQRRVEDLPHDQQITLTNVGNAIIASYQPGGQPVRVVKIYGHADWDTPRNPQREQQMSDERAQMAGNWLKSYVGGSIAAQISWDIRGFGATQLKAQPTTEENRRQNRRVEVTITKLQPSTGCPCPPPASPYYQAAPQARSTYCPVWRPKLCFYQDCEDKIEDRDGFRNLAALHASRICAIEAPGDPCGKLTVDNTSPFPYRKITIGPTPYRTGRDIIWHIRRAYACSNSTSKVNEVHIYSHSGPEGVYSYTWTVYDGLYAENADRHNPRLRGATTVASLPFEVMAENVIFVLHGCDTAKKSSQYDPNFARSLMDALLRNGKFSARVYAHPDKATQGGSGGNNNWIEFSAKAPQGKKMPFNWTLPLSF